jgi:hypothetical protein
MLMRLYRNSYRETGGELDNLFLTTRKSRKKPTVGILPRYCVLVDVESTILRMTEVDIMFIASNTRRFHTNEVA